MVLHRTSTTNFCRMKNAVLYQAYGGTAFVNECRFALLKYLHVYNLKPPASTAVFIYTDKPHLFSDFEPFFHHLHCRPMSAETVKAWRGDIDFVHRVKIKMMEDLLRDFSGNLLYCDTDTCATAPLENIFAGIEAGTAFMHEYEGRINGQSFPAFAKWEKFLSANPVPYNGKHVVYQPSLQMFNAGVVGLRSGDKALLADVLALTDGVYRKFPKHIAEQFAFSYCLQQNRKIEEAKNEVAHYWNLKEFRQLLAVFFQRNHEESVPNLVKKAAGINALNILEQKTAYEKRPLFSRLFKSLTGKAWKISDYERKL